MIGGKVLQVVHLHADNEIELLCVDTDHAIHDECVVRIQAGIDIPQVGDDVWWQSGVVYWTPADRRFMDRPIKKVGYSCTPHVH
jgi:hypothetical protein